MRFTAFAYLLFALWLTPQAAPPPAAEHPAAATDGFSALQADALPDPISSGAG